MPYKTLQEALKKHPNLKDYSAKAQRGWLGSINQCFADGGNDEKCFAIAYSTANKVDGKSSKGAALELLRVARSLISHFKTQILLTELQVFGAFDIGDDLYDMGFDWRPKDKLWYISLRNITPKIERELHKLGVWW